MLNIHFNGEVVRCKNMKIIANRTAERFEAENRCKYGIVKLSCHSWVKHCQLHDDVRTISSYGKCNLAGCDNCPEYKKRSDNGNKKKTFTIDWKKYRQISSAAHYLIKESPHKTLFLTLSFPQFKRRAPYPHQTYQSRADLIANHKYTKSFYYDEISNIKFSQFAENLRKNHNCSGYIAVKEYGEATQRVHFHFIVSYPFIDFRYFNDIWVNCISDICFYSSCAVRRAPGAPAIIRNPARAIRYVCKYINKSYGIKSDTRVVFISRNLLSEKYTIKKNVFNYETGQYEEKTETVTRSKIRFRIEETENNHIDYLKGFKSIYINTFDHVTVYKITDRREFNKFCHQFLYPLFECSFKWSSFHYEPTEKPG